MLILSLVICGGSEVAKRGRYLKIADPQELLS